MNIFVRLRLDISMVVICYASDVTEYDKRASELSNAILHMKQDTNSTVEDIPYS